MSSYPALAIRTHLSGGVRLCRPTHDQPATTLESPAMLVMTDLTRVAAVVVSPATTVDEANRYMMRRGVRMLLVLDDQERLSGIVTSTDILGEKPVTLARERGVRHSEILVADVMTPASRLDAFDIRSVQGASVGHVVASLQRSRRHHALVVQDAEGGLEVRGVISLSQIARQLGTPLQLPEAADNFAEIEAALVR
ncbi:MAG TPA: CBS domain-containing protein [Ramlibacter sp.]|nr:CBS domain-containing protein [Ramlibacter sp.]